MGQRLLDVLRLYRIHTGGATSAVPLVAGFISNCSPVPLLLIGLGSLFHHAWGFSLNEIVDMDIDRRSGLHEGKPLVSGRMTRGQAHFFSLSALLASFTCFIVASLLQEGSVLLVILLLAGASVSGTIYDVWGKRFPLSDIFVGLWLAMLALSASAVSGMDQVTSTPVIAAALLVGIHVLFNNSVEGGIKDAEGDRTSGVRSLAVISGVRWSGSKLYIPGPFCVWAMLLRGAFVVIAAVFSYQISIQEGFGSWISITVSIFGIILFAHSLGFIRSSVHRSRSDLIRTFSQHEVMSLALSLLVVLPAAGIIPAAGLLLLPLIWFILFNRIMFGSTLSPKV